MATAKKSTARKSPSKYGPAAGASVARELHAMHEGELMIGNSGKRVTNPKQAIALALSESRRAGNQVPPAPKKTAKKAAKKSAKSQG